MENYFDVNGIEDIKNKIQLYIEIEEEYLSKIENTLSELKNKYRGFNDKTLDYKVNNTIMSLNTMLDNKKKYIAFLNNTLNGYVVLDKEIASEYNKTQY